MYSTDHIQLNVHSHLTRKGGASACKRSMQHSRVAYELVRVRVQVGVGVQVQWSIRHP